ncbi:MAG: T9SS type A sorting domain-containing protein [Bacteroidia bacterium]|nr:T9SS type A sorting domain-containing protein [Bacteroidia bacterium]
MKLKFYKTTLFSTFLSLFIFSSAALNAQCSITYEGSLCVGNPISFSCNTIGSSQFNWDFNGEGSNLFQCNPIFTFASPGIKTINLSLKLIDGSSCNAQITFKISEPPVIKSSSISNYIQCFKDNNYCFNDSSTVANDSICKRTYLFDDGSIYTFYGNGKINFCHHFLDPSGGIYGVTVTAVSCNGCSSSKRLNFIAQIRPRLSPNFTSPIPVACDSLLLTVTNTSAILSDSIQSFEWDWGDGSKTIGDKNQLSKWGVQVQHKYKTPGPNNGYFDIQLTVTDHFGCTESFLYKNAAAVLFTQLKLLANFDSVCISNSEIEFKLNEGEISMGTNPLYIFEVPTIPSNIQRSWSAAHKFSKLGPHLVKFSFSHPIPGCSRTITDTILVVGPLSIIENGIPNDMSSKGKYQCIVKDSVHFSNFSQFYHNDDDFIDDDSVLIQNKGFNAPLVHVFNFGSQSTLKPKNQVRSDNHTIRVWDFGDDYCERCTTDSKNYKNITKNCRYSKDMLPTHLYKDWQDIYTTEFSTKAQTMAYFNADSGFINTRKVCADDSLSIVRDSVLFYANNPMGIQTKDSSIFINITKNVLSNFALVGPTREDFNQTCYLYIKSNNSIYLDPNNGNPTQLITGNNKIKLLAGQSLILQSALDTVYYHYFVELSQDTISKNLSLNKKVWKNIANTSISPFDSINPALHRQRFYLGNDVHCFEAKLYVKDIKHPLACASESSVKLALAPPSAQNLRKSGLQCFGSDQSNYGITFILDETKPGCNTTWVEINTNYQADSNNWTLAVGKNLSTGQISMGDLPPVNPPYLAFTGSKAPGTHFSVQYGSSEIISSDGTIDVGLIIGNGLHSNGIYPQECQDTVIYRDFARFPIIDASFEILSGRIIDDATNFCKLDPIVLRPKINNKTNIQDLGSTSYSITNLNAGKFHNQFYKYEIKETYDRFKEIHKDSNFLMDYLVIERKRIFENDTTITSQTIPIAKIFQWHVEADISEVYDAFKSQLNSYSLNLNDFNSNELTQLIWNGVGSIGKNYTGSRGLVDTSGFGHLIRFTKIADSKLSLHKRDSSFTPHESHFGRNNQLYEAYEIKPEFNGFYLVEFAVKSPNPKYCTINSFQKAIVGFFVEMNYQDTIICPGQTLYTKPQLHYYNQYPEIYTTGCPNPNSSLLDCYDYWRNRIAEAGNANREGYTIHDLNKDDDGTHPQSIFGGYPYSITGLENLPNNVLKIGGNNFDLYYNLDTGKTYVIRTASSDSMGCRDTFVQNIHVIASRAKIKLSHENINCNSIISLSDSSYLQDPISQITGQPSTKFNRWTINWNDKSLNNTTEIFNTFPNEIEHTYARNGNYMIKLTVQNELGCNSMDSMYVSFPGPIPFFDTLQPRHYCRNESIQFYNESYYKTSDSCTWIWDFDDGNFKFQSFDINSNNNPINYSYKNQGTYLPKLYLYYKKRVNNSYINCRDVFPNSDYKENNQFIFINPCDSTSINSLELSNSVLMYPNPANNWVTFESKEPVTISIYNTLGQEIETLNIETIGYFDLRHLSAGIYIVKTSEEKIIGKLIVN